MTDSMRDEYDFSNAVRGKFYRKNARIQMPIYLDESVQQPLMQIAEQKGIALSDLINQLLQKDVELLEIGKSAS